MARLGQGPGLSFDTLATATLGPRPPHLLASPSPALGEHIFISAQDTRGIFSELSPGTSCLTTIGGIVFRVLSGD